MGIQSELIVVPLYFLLIMYIELDCIFEVNDNESVTLIRNDNSPL
jgi:hypothetical protein